MLYAMVGNCPLCTGELVQKRAFRRRGEESVALLRCLSCRTEQLHPQTSADWLAAEYSIYNQRVIAGIERPRKVFFRKLLLDAGVNPAGKRILDVGCAEGDCIAAINEIAPTAEITGVEPYGEAFPGLASLRCRTITQPIELCLAQFEPDYFDIVLLCDVLEHLRSPVEILRKITAATAPGGIILVTTPDVDSLSRRMFGRFWWQYKPDHLFYFSRSALRKMGEHAGLDTQKMQSLKKTLPLAYLYAVGRSASGPLFRTATRMFFRITPSSWLHRNLTAYFGELLWIAKKPAL